MDLSLNHYDTQRGFQTDARSQSDRVLNQPIRERAQSINLKTHFSIVINVKKVSHQKNKSFYHMIERKRQRKRQKIRLQGSYWEVHPFCQHNLGLLIRIFWMDVGFFLRLSTNSAIKQSELRPKTIKTQMNLQKG